MTIRSEIEDELDRARTERNTALDGSPTNCQYNTPGRAAAFWHGHIIAMEWIFEMIAKGEPVE